MLVVPAVGVLTCSTLNLLTADTSAAAPSFLVLPTLWAAVQLHTGGAWLVTGLAISCNAAVVLHLEAFGAAITGLVTRRVLDEAIAAALTVTSTRTGTSVILVDVVACKAIIDAHGHPVGDDAL